MADKDPVVHAFYTLYDRGSIATWDEMQTRMIEEMVKRHEQVLHQLIEIKTHEVRPIVLKMPRDPDARDNYEDDFCAGELAMCGPDDD